jgi:uncharacterized protein YciI
MSEDLPSLEQLMAEQVNVGPLWAITMVPTDKFKLTTPEGKALLREHYLYLRGLQQRGVLVASGPLDFEIAPAAGLMVIRAPSREEAARISKGEPFHAAGWRQHTLSSWLIRWGNLSGALQSFLETKEK